MRTGLWLVMGMVVLCLIPANGRSQFPPGGSSRGGPPSGGEARGPRGGRGGPGGDPSAFFDRLAQGRDVINRAELDPRMQPLFDRWAASAGVTNGQLTRQQFAAAMQQGGAGRFGASGGPGGAPGMAGPAGAFPPGGPGRRGFGEGRGGPGGFDPAAMADGFFRRSDQNGDGILNNDELPEALRSERDKWDTDRNGLIDSNEFQAYIQARFQQAQAGRSGPAPSGPGDSREGLGLELLVPPVEEEERRPVVYHAGKLPRELPSWFAQLDTDRDAQVGLYEWRGGSRPLEEFTRLDRNEDGFLTVEEVLRSTTAAAPRPGENQVAGGRPAFGGGNGPGGFRGAGGPGMSRGMGGPAGGPREGGFRPGGGPGMGRDRAAGPGAAPGGPGGFGRGRTPRAEER